MTEAEAIYQIAYNQELNYVLMQWWLGVSVGMLAVGHFFSKKLNALITGFVIVAYVLYSLFVLDNISWIIGNQISLVDHLKTLQEEDGLTGVGRQYLASGSTITFGETWGFVLSTVAMFFGSILYLVYGYIQARRERLKEC